MGPMSIAAKSIESASANYLKDLDALTEEQILNSLGGAARRPVDFTFETALVNRRIAARLRGIEPPGFPNDEGWTVAPAELCSKTAILAYMSDSCNELLDAARSVPEEEADRLVGVPGSERPAFAMASFAAMHTMYHDAQLNYIQTLAGDLTMHWD